ncbi:MAG: hypothetical protein JNL08_09220 [Planctomycetes bacterium]|nr:hypothetical protein [Planctomycetota bacterium]
MTTLRPTWFAAVVCTALPIAAQDGPWALRIDRVDLGEFTPVAHVVFTNTSAAPVALCPPLDGSTYGMVQPHYEFVVDRGGRRPSVPARCGNHGGDYREEGLVVVAPGATAAFDVAVPALLTPGTWNVTLRYSIVRTDAPLGERGARLWFGSVASPAFALPVPGPVWDEWLALPDAALAERLAAELGAADAAVVGAAVDALVQLEADGRRDAIATPVRAALRRACATLVAGVRDEVPQRFDRQRHLALQLAALLASPSLPEPERARAELHRALRGARGAGRQALFGVLAAQPTDPDVAEAEAELARPDGAGETFRLALEILAARRGKDAAVEQAMAVLERTPPGQQFLDYAHAVSHLTDDYEPSYVRVGDHGRMFPSEPAQYRQVKQQWSDWWRARRAR